MTTWRVRTTCGGRSIAACAIAWFLFAAPPAIAEDVLIFQRGDVTCSGTRTAADVMAATRGLAGASTCSNDDCDRDGSVSSDDVDCTARCLFGQCPVPPHAPRVSSVVAAEMSQIAPSGIVRLTGVNFGPEDGVKRVLVGDVEAEVIDFIAPDTIEIVVPPVPPGDTTVVVTDGDLAGSAFALTLAAPVPVGDPDTFDGTMTLVGTLLSRLADLPLEQDGENGAALRQHLQQTSVDVLAQWAAIRDDPAFSPETRTALDAAIDASGAPEMLRSEIADVEELLGSMSGAGGAAGVEVVLGAARALQIARTLNIAAAAARGLAAVAAGTAATAGATISIPALLVTAVVIGTVGGVIAAFSQGTPMIFKLEFRDASDATRRFPTAGGTVTVRGAQLGTPFSTGLQVSSGGGAGRGGAFASGDDFLSFRLGDVPGMCGYTTFQLFATRLDFASNPISTRIQPEFLGLSTSSVPLNGPFTVFARGVGVCRGGYLRYERSDTLGLSPSFLRETPETPHAFATAALGSQPALYQTSVQLAPLVSDEVKPLDVTTNITGLTIECQAHNLELRAVGNADSVECSAHVLPAGAPFPVGVNLQWHSSDASITLGFFDNFKHTASAKAQLPGTATVTATIMYRGQTYTSNGETLEVTDTAEPSAEIHAPAQVDPGESFSVTVNATDNVFVTRIILLASGDPVASISAEQEFPCAALEPQCEANFSVSLVPGLTDKTVSLVAQVFDGSGNSGSSQPVTVKVGVDDSPPKVHIERPSSGGRVRAGDTVEVSVRLADNEILSDTGVQRVSVTAVGPAVATGPTPEEVVLPVLLPQGTRLTSFKVRSAAEIANLANKTITVTARATDGAGNMAMDEITVTVAAPVITSVSPDRVGAGTLFRIDGDGFGESQGNGSVSVGGLIAAVASWDNNTILATVPETASGMVGVVVTVDGQPSNSVSITVLGTGDVQITLKWSDTNDLDLYVTDPNGELIYFNNKMSASGGILDVDANANCEAPISSPSENVFWPAGTAPTGLYTVRVNYYDGCTDPKVPSTFSVTAVVDGHIMTLIANSQISGGSQETSFTR